MAVEQNATDSVDASQKDGADNAGAQDGSLASFLAEFDQTQNETPDKGADAPSVDDIVTQVSERLEAQRAEQESLDKGAEVFAQATGLSKDASELYLLGLAAKNFDAAVAAQKAGRFDEFAQKAAKEFAQADRVDTQTTVDRDAVAAAVRGASQRTPPPEDLSAEKLHTLSNSEFEALKHKLRAGG